jgi:hypothetical protein
MRWKHALNSVAIVGLVLLVGCAPKSRAEGVPWVTKKHKATDAKLQRVAHWPALRVDSASVAMLDEALAEPNLEQATPLALAFIDRAADDARESTRLELALLDNDGWREINARYYGRDAVPDAQARQALAADFERDAADQATSLRDRLSAARTTGGLRRELRPVRGGVEPSVKASGRVARAAPWFPFTIPSLLMIARINDREWRGPQDAPFESAVRYSPLADAGAFGQARHADLLARYAPVIVQETPAHVSYPPSDDQFGCVTASERDDFMIDVSAATVYAYARNIRIRGRAHVQLVYTHWYPEHPALKKNDAEHGKPEGVTLRITLDADHQPALMETVYNCGCYHRLYPSEKLEADAKAQFGAPEKGKALAIERNVSMKIDMIVPKAVAVTAAAARPVIRCRAGWHGIVDVAFTEGAHAKEVARQVEYALRPYDDLERLDLADGRGVTSMFYDNGLVKKAQRPEGVFFTPAGLLSAGQPRQRGTQLIHWDHYDFDDPHLFERTLRLPRCF